VHLTLIRHGTAVDGGARDADRTLTVAGRDEVRRAAVAFAKTEPVPDLIVSSPYVRAVQTAELVAAVVGYRGAVAIDRALEPDAPPGGVVTLIEQLSAQRHVLFAAHEPILSAACGLLLRARCPVFARAEMLSVLLTFTQTDVGRVARAALRWRAVPT
jgi:phosphohistidine phosphatase